MTEDIDIKKALKEIIETLPKLKKYDEIKVGDNIFRFNQDKVIIFHLSYIEKVLHHFYEVFFKVFPKLEKIELEKQPKDIELSYII